jgi:hypothetical protein
MTPTVVTVRLREKLGHEASEDLVHAFEDTKKEMLAVAHDRFDARLSVVASELRQEMAKMDANLRVSMAEGFASIRQEISEMRVELIRASFLFWLGQFVAILAVLGYMLRGVAR